MITEGKAHIKTYADSNTKSGQPLIRSFCGECGSSLFLKNVTIDLTIVNTGSIDDKLETGESIYHPRVGAMILTVNIYKTPASKYPNASSLSKTNGRGYQSRRMVVPKRVYNS